jgi:hypothetical protein
MRKSILRGAHVRNVGIAVALAATTACGGFRNTQSAQDRAVISFTNESLDQADVYAVTATQSVRIGTVLAGRTESLVVPGDIAFRGQNLNVVARLLAQSRRPSTGPITLSPGQRIEVRLPMDQRQLWVLPGN